MRLTVCRTLLTLSTTLLLAGTAGSQGKSPLDNLAIDVTGASREFVYTNKASAHYYGETSASNKPGWMGFTVYGHRMFDDYALLINGEELDRKTALVTTVYPDYLLRKYPGGFIEQLRIVDSVSMIALMITAPKPVEVTVIPLFSDARTSDAYDVRLSESMVSLARKSHPKRTEREDYPVWLSVYAKDYLPLRREDRRGSEFSPVALTSRRSRTHIVSFAVADDEETSGKLAAAYTANAASYFNKRRARMEHLLAESSARTGDPRFDEALAWAKLSLDALMMNQVTKGIYAGLPWFNNYWGRDTFISLPGATLVTGRFREAKELLRSFASFQMTDSTSTDYGRIPNIVTTTSKGYNTADGTPRCVIIAREYIERSGDDRFILEIYPTILRAIEGTIRYHTDALGFLTHGDAETWMDAAGPDGAWSPRGNRANDVQALWAQQLDAGVWFAARIGDVVSARRWHDLLGKVKRNFAEQFLVHGAVADRLQPDGSPDLQLRPNQIFTSPLLPDSVRAKMLHTVVTQLTYEYGVASLAQTEENFHPYHQFSPYYPKDAAYHNGTVWTWLQGSLISELCAFGRQDFAAKLTENAVHQILDRGTVGSQSELLDAVPRPGEKEPQLSGTCTQAWNLAEFVRNFYDDYLGARVELLTHTMTLRPRLPRTLGDVSARLNLGGQYLGVQIQRDDQLTTVTFDGSGLKETLQASVDLATGSRRQMTTSVELHPTRKVRIELNGEEVSVTSNGSERTNSSHKLIAVDDFTSLLEPLRFATPVVRAGLASMKGPAYPLLDNRQVKAVNRSATVLVDATDPAGDDLGTGHYTYPSNPNFVPGILDITGLKVAADSTNAYFTLKFRALADPGWHPEYGFQLTFAAIAIDEDGVKGSGAIVIPRNSGFGLDSSHAYERVIFIGGGLMVEDQHGTALAAYLPVDADATNPLGNASAGTISFALPLRLLGTPRSSWTYVVVTGGQDDHGGAGLGEFRKVGRVAGEWNGGGTMKESDPNVYDVLVAPQK